MEATAFIAQCESRGIAIFLNTKGEIDALGPQELLTERFRGILRDYAGLLKPVLSVPVSVTEMTAGDGFDEETATDTPTAIATSATAAQKEETPVQLVWEQGKRIPYMVVCWIGKTGDRFASSAVSNQYGFGDSKAGALKNLLATMGNIGTPGNLRRIVGRVYAELESVEEGDSLEAASLATTDHGLPPVFEWTHPEPPKRRNYLLTVRFADGCYLEAKGQDQGETWEGLQRHPAATPEQQWWLLKAGPIMAAA